MADNPISREEIFLAAAAGEYFGKLPDPITREEKYLKAIAENGGGGSADAYTKSETDTLLTAKADKAATYTKSETDARITEKVAEIVADAPSDFDTLKEMSDWIDSHEDSAAAMNSEIRANTLAIAGKVDKVTGKGLSTEDYTTAEKTKLAGLSNYDDTALQTAVANKVDKVSGKGLSTEDYTTAEKTKLSGIEDGAEVNIQPDWEQSDSTADDFIKNKPTLGSAASRSAVLSLSNAGSGLPTSGTVYAALGNKVDKVTGKGLSTEDYTSAEKTKLDGIETGANKTIVDSALSSSSTNPVQNNVIYNALYYLGTAIESRTDLNDLTVPGTYYSSSSSISGSLLNCPLQYIGFKLRVYYTSSTARIEQEIIPNIIDSTYHEIYKRSIVSGTAGDWYKFTGEVVQANT